MGKKWKGLTTIGLMAGSEVGADFFRPWRAAKARKEFMERDVDFIIFPGALLNIEAMNAEFRELTHDRKKDKESKANSMSQERERFCRRYLKQILEEVFVPLERDGEIIKYWVFPCPLFELKKDKFGLAAYIYENLPKISQKISGKDPYIRVGSGGELIEIEDNVAIRTLGVIMPITSFFRAKILSTPIEREITYQQLSSIRRSIPDLYIAGAFAVSLNEVNPRTIPMSRPYVSIPSLSIKFAETILENTLGFAVLKLYPDQKNRAQHQISFHPLDDAVKLECAYTQKQIQYLKDEDQRKVAEVIVDKVRLGTKVTIGKIESATGIDRERVLKALKELKKTSFCVDVELGEVKNPYQIIPRTKRDLTEYREGVERERTIVAMACLHIPDASVDYDFIENDLHQILFEEKVDVMYLVGDLTEGNKYDQDRKGQLLDRFSYPQDQKKLAGYLIATRIILPLFKMRYGETHDVARALLRIVTIPGNHDEVKNEPPLESYRRVLVSATTDFIYGYLSENGGDKGGIDYHRLMELVREKLVFLDNPSIDGDVGMLHEYSQSAEQSTGKVQKAIKQFFAFAPQIRTLLLANHHEKNFLLLRIGDRTIKTYHLGTLKRFYPFESQRSKISEFGIAIDHEVFKDGMPIRIDTKFVPSRTDFQMQDSAEFIEKNRIRGIRYYDELNRYLDKGLLPVKMSDAESSNPV